MRLFRRRDVLKAVALMGFSGTALGGYTVAETFRQSVTRYALNPPGWIPGLKVRLAVIADLHVCEPWMSLERVDEIVRQTNALGADAVLLLGDYVSSHGMSRYSNHVMCGAWAEILSRLRAPLGVHAVLGNHDWWDEYEIQTRRSGPVPAGLALQAVGIPVYENDVLRLEKDGKPFWLAGLGDQWAFWPKPEDEQAFVKRGKKDYTGVDDLPATLAKITDDAPVVLMAHEPDIFPEVPARVSLTISGHTHGGQVRVFGFAPFIPSKYGARYLYGHKVEDGRNLIVSAGLGCSGYPIRFGATPEIVLIELGSGVSA